LIDQATRLCDNLRVVSVLQKLQKLTAVCQAGGIAVPLDHMLARRSALSDELSERYFGVGGEPDKSKNKSSENTPSSSSPNYRPTGAERHPAGYSPRAASTTVNISARRDNEHEILQNDRRSNPFNSTGEPSAVSPAIDAALAASARVEEEFALSQRDENNRQRKNKWNKGMVGEGPHMDVMDLRKKTRESQKLNRLLKISAVVALATALACILYFRYGVWLT
jgi:hypothetical protein